MILSLITPPEDPAVTLSELKAHLRVDHTDEDDLIAALGAAAEGMLDGWRGVLGRAIMPQEWRQEFAGWGELSLALPDVESIEVTYLDQAGAEQPASTSELRRTVAGYVVVASGPDAGRVFVDMVCKMGPQHLAVVRAAIKMIVSHWFHHREAVASGGFSEVPLSANALIGTLRWARL